MNNQQAVVDQVVQNLAFDVEAVPKYDSTQNKSVSQSTSLNVKIKVRKKDDINMQHDVSPIADNTSRTVQKVRLVNSDQTIMTFDVFMEAEFEKKPRKHRKHIFDLLKPGICLRAVDDDERPHIPSTSYSANITEPTMATKSNGTLKQTFTLSKNVFQTYSVSTQPVVQKWLFGNCKPGGCLDPPFSEDKYSYKPSLRLGPEREENDETVENKPDVSSDKKPIMLHDEETQSNGRHSSIFDSGLFKKKRKSSDKSTNTKLADKTDSIVDVYQGVSASNSESTHSNPIITYPPKPKGNPRVTDDKTVRSMGPSDEKPRHSFNDHSEPYFVPPKGVQRIKEKVTLDPNDQLKPRSSDAADLRDLLKESLKVPVPLPIPIPVPVSIGPSKRKPEVIATNDDIIKKDSIPDQDIYDQKLQDQKVPDQDLQGTINLKDIKISPRLSRTKSEREDTDKKPVESLITPTLMPSNIEPTLSNEIDDQKLDETKLPLETKYNENYKEASPPQNIKKKTASSKIPVSVPVLFPINFNDPNRTDTDATDSMTNDNIDGDMKSSYSKKSFEIKAMPSTLKDTPFEDFKDTEQNIEPSLGEKEPFLNVTPSLKHSNTETDAIPENFLRTGGNFSDQESDSEMPINLDMKEDSNREIDAMPENFLRTGGNLSDQESDTEMPINLDMKGDSNTEKDAIPENFLRTRGIFSDRESDNEMPINLDTKRLKEKQNTDEVRETAKQNDNVNKATINTKTLMKRGSKEAEITDKIIKPAEQNDAKRDIIPDFEEKIIIDSIEKLTKQTDIEDKTLTPTLYSKDDIKQYSVGIKVTEGIEKPSNQKDINNKAAIPTKDDIKPYFEGDKITDGIEKPETQNESILTKYSDEDRKRDSKEETITGEIEKLTNQKNIKVKPVSATKYAEDSPDVFRIPETNQNIDTPKKDERKDSQRILSVFPILQNDTTSLQNASKISIKYKTKRSDTLDFVLDNIENGDTDLGINKDEKLLSLTSNPDYKTDIGNSEISDQYKNKEYVSETVKPNVDKIDSYTEIKLRHTNGERANATVASATVINTDETSILGSTKEVYNEKKIVKSMDPSFQKFDDDKNAYSTASHDLIGSKSVIYNTDGFVPSTSAEKLGGGTAISSNQSANTLKSAMKKDTVFIDFGFHSYLNDKNERIVQTVDSANAPRRLSNDSITVIKSQIRISTNEIRIPVDSEHDIFIQIKKANANQRVSISESRLVNTIDTEKANKQRSPMQYSDVETGSSEEKAEGRKDKIQETATADRFLDYYEQELVPLQLIIKNLREEIDFLATQQSIFKDKLYCTNKSKLPRLIHSNKKCFGCIKK